jgi:hypothetical protein
MLFSWAGKHQGRSINYIKQKNPIDVYPLIEHAANHLLGFHSSDSSIHTTMILVIRIRRANRYTPSFFKRNQQAEALDFLEQADPSLYCESREAISPIDESHNLEVLYAPYLLASFDMARFPMRLRNLIRPKVSLYNSNHTHCDFCSHIDCQHH